MDTPVLADQQERTYIICVDTGRSLEDLGVIDDIDGWREKRVRAIHAASVIWW